MRHAVPSFRPGPCGGFIAFGFAAFGFAASGFTAVRVSTPVAARETSLPVAKSLGVS